VGFRLLGALGRTLVTAGTLILLFVSYQLWGTGLQEARSQDALSEEFASVLAGLPDLATTTTTTTAPTTTTPGTTQTTLALAEVRTDDLPLPEIGDPIAKIRIPSIGVNRTIVEGVPLSQLKRGPGHYPETPFPGQKGNVAIAGHRTTYGQPFHNIDKVEVGDEIIFETPQGEFVYEATGTLIVEPDQIEILEDKGDNRVTLIACHPKYSAAKRIIVIGELKGRAAPFYTGQDEYREKAAEVDAEDGLADGATIDGGLSGEEASKAPAILWGLAAAGVWLVTWIFQVLIRRRTRARAEAEGTTPGRGRRLLAYTPYLVGLPVFLVVLYVFFENFGRLLPGNY